MAPKQCNRVPGTLAKWSGVTDNGTVWPFVILSYTKGRDHQLTLTKSGAVMQRTPFVIGVWIP